MLPFLQIIHDKKEHTSREIKKTLAKYFKLSGREHNESMPSGENHFNVNTSWAKTYLEHAGLLEQNDFGSFKITDRGLETLKQEPEKIDRKYLKRFEEFVAWHEKINIQNRNLLIRHNPSEKRISEKQKRWNNVLGKEYHFKKIPNYKVMQPNIAVIWFYTDNNDIYLWGYSNIKNINEAIDGEFIAVMKDFHSFDPRYNKSSRNIPRSIRCTPNLEQQIKNGDSWNIHNSIIRVDKDIFDQILKITAWPTDIELPTLSNDSLRDARVKISEEILIDDDTLNQIFSTLLSGTNVLLVGPVGSGKTNLATILPEIAWQEFSGYFSEVYTAIADWTVQDVIGGIYPKLDENNQIIYSIQRGCVSETIYENLARQYNSSMQATIEKTVDGKTKKYRGVWLVIDEFNRANIDRAFGQLFTALEYGSLKIPTTDPNQPFDELHIPKDYRIIGTLNTADKHFLHTLSDALKRRFAIIELPIPMYNNKNLELYHVVKKSLLKLEKKSTALTIDHSTKRVQQGSDPQAEEILNVLYHLMLYIRVIKPLGTALLITMFRFMITYHDITQDWQKGLDLALTSTILPQLESLPYWTLNVIREMFCRDVPTFFKKNLVTEDDYEKYMADFIYLIDFLKYVGRTPNNIITRFKNKNLNDEDYTSLNPWNEDIPKPVLPVFQKSITAIIEEKGFNSEIEYE